MNFIQPSIDPVIFSISFFELRWYSLSYILGFLMGSLLIANLNIINGNVLTKKKLDSFLLWAVLGVIIGGRVGYVLFYQTEIFLSKPSYIFEIWNGGMSFHGGLFGIIISIYFFCIKNNINFFYISDLVSIAAPIGLFFGRIANFINTELIGRTTEFYISVIYPSIDNEPRHPSQLYEAFCEGILLFIILLICFSKKNIRKKYGYISGIFLCFYSLFRFSIEFLREPDAHLGLFFDMVSMGQILSIPLFVFGLILIFYNGFKRRT